MGKLTPRDKKITVGGYQSKKKPKTNTMSYGGRRHGKTSLGMGGLNSLWAGFTDIPQERWDAIDWSK